MKDDETSDLTPPEDSEAQEAPPPAGYAPAIVPVWSGGPTAESFAALRLTPWRLRVFPGTVLLGKGGEVLDWRAPDEGSDN